MGQSRPDSDPSIRLATAGDLQRILEIEGLSFEKPWDCHEFKAALNDVFLVFEEREVLGFLCACCSAVGNTAVILKIAVHPDYRGKGIATRLISAVLARLRTLRVAEVGLDVDVVKRGAIHLYERFGFQIWKAVTANHEEDEGFYEMKLKLDSE
jgi:ribosomal-protein-alanine N-acetyltransferase